MTHPTHRTMESPRTTRDTERLHDADKAPDTAASHRGRDTSNIGTVPAGGAGSDSGAADAVGVDPEDSAEIPDRSWGNDAPGVGTRRPHRANSAETTGDPSVPDCGGEQHLPEMHDDREDPGVERSLRRRLLRDAGPDAARFAVDPGVQSRPRMAQNVATPEQEVWGLLTQTRIDFPHADRRRLREVLQERLCQAGIDMPADEVDAFLRARPADRNEH